MSADVTAPYIEIMKLVSVMTRTPPGSLQISLRPHERGWAAVVGRAGVDMQFGVGPNPEVAISVLYRSVKVDAKTQLVALERILEQADESPELEGITVSQVSEVQSRRK